MPSVLKSIFIFRTLTPNLYTIITLAIYISYYITLHVHYLYICTIELIQYIFCIIFNLVLIQFPCVSFFFKKSDILMSIHCKMLSVSNLYLKKYLPSRYIFTFVYILLLPLLLHHNIIGLLKI